MRRYPSYLAYRPSGVDWLGDIPQGWEVKPVFALYSRRVERGHTEAMLLSVYRDYGVIPRDERDDNFNRPSLDLSAYQLVKPRDLVLNKMKTWQGSLAVSKHSGIVSPAYIICRPNHREYDRFLHYLLRSPAYIAQYSRLSYGVRVAQWDMRFEDFRRVQVLLPSLSEQRSIADFLDRETARIDALITKKQRLIELLQEKRTALISHAVTKGLGAGVAMKESGVPWLGQVPAHWEIRPLRAVVQLRRGFDLTVAQRETGTVPVYSSSGLSGYHDTALVKGPGVVTGRYGTVGQIFYVEDDFWPMNTALYGKEFWGNDPQYVSYLLTILPFDAYSGKSAVPGIDRNDLDPIKVACPPRDEQLAIASHLVHAGRKLENAAQKNETAIARLQEYRTALISAAVTGKIDVREEEAS